MSAADSAGKSPTEEGLTGAVRELECREKERNNFPAACDHILFLDGPAPEAAGVKQKTGCYGLPPMIM